MVALWNRADHFIFILWFLSSSFCLSFSSANLSGRRLDVCHTSTHGVALVRTNIVENTIFGANLECRSETCCTPHAARWNCRTQKSSKRRHLRIMGTNLSGYIVAIKALSTTGKKLVKQQYLLQMSPQYGELGPTSG